MNYALVDIGNTSIKAKIYDKSYQEISSFIVNKSTQSLIQFFKEMKKVNRYLVSSVVPELNSEIKKLKPSDVVFLDHDDFSELSIDVNPVKTVGIDRLVNAIAVKYKWDANILVVDMGTVTTFCRIEKGGKYRGGAILPGFQMISSSLNEKTAQLPKVHFPLEAPPLIGKSTKSAIEAGLFHGGIQMVNGVIQKYKKHSQKLAVIVTGGVPGSMLKHIEHDIFEKDLQFMGLNILYRKKIPSLNITG